MMNVCCLFCNTVNDNNINIAQSSCIKASIWKCTARPDFNELDVLLDQQWNNILIPKFNLDRFPKPKPNLTH